MISLTISVPMILAALHSSVGDVPLDLINVMPSATRSAAAFTHFSQGYKWTRGGNRVRWIRNERADAVSPWFRIQSDYSTSYEISTVRDRLAGDELYVAGVERSGSTIIERWKFSVRNGRWQHTLGGQVNPYPAASGAYSGTTSIKGGVWKDPVSDAHVTPTRETILDSTSIGVIRWLAVDPEGRFILFQDHTTSNVYRIVTDTSPVGAPELLYTPVDYPDLSEMHFATVSDFTTNGDRVVLVFKPRSAQGANSTDRRLVLHDTNNDGQWDSVHALDYAPYKALYLGAVAQPWKRD